MRSFKMDGVKEKTVDLNASDLEACRICLGTDIKLHSLQDTGLGTCMESIGGFTKSFEGLPNYVCYECAPILIKCNKLIEKSKTADLALLEIFNKNGQINKLLIEEQKKSITKLQTSLDSYLLLNYYYTKYDDDTNTAECIKIDSDSNEKISIRLKNVMEEQSKKEVADSEILKMLMSNDLKEKEVTKDLSKEDEMTKGLSKEDEMIKDLSKEDEMTIDLSKEDETTIDLSKEEGIQSDSDIETIEVEIPVIKIESDDEKMGDDFISLKSYDVKTDDPLKGLLAYIDVVPQCNKVNKMKHLGSAKRAKKKKKKKMHRLMETRTKYQDEDKFVRRYFNIQQRWRGNATNKKYFCKFCPEIYYYVEDARDHVITGCEKPSSNNNIPGPEKPDLGASSSQPFWPGPQRQ